jgi:hypothetical protein
VYLTNMSNDAIYIQYAHWDNNASVKTELYVDQSNSQVLYDDLAGRK